MMLVRTDFSAPGEPVEIQVYRMKNKPDGSAGLAEPGEQPDFWDISVRGDPDEEGEIHHFVEYENITDLALVDFALDCLGRQFPDLEAEYVGG